MLGLRRKNTFRNGVHPPERKDETAHLPIRQFSFAPLLIVPLSQHLGKPAVPVVREGQIAIGSVMMLALSFDHRIVDGQQAAAFTCEVAEKLQDPEALLKD